MARYFLHLRDGTDFLLDEEGQEFADAEALRSAVLASARCIMAGDMGGGVIDLRCRIEAEDEAGDVAYSLAFVDAVTIMR
jgi:hypothetical protein